MEALKDAAEYLVHVIWPTYEGDLAPAILAIAAVQKSVARHQAAYDEALKREVEEWNRVP